MKREYNALHQRHTEVKASADRRPQSRRRAASVVTMTPIPHLSLSHPLQMIQTYVEHIERSKLQQAGSNSQSEGTGCGRT